MKTTTLIAALVAAAIAQAHAAPGEDIDCSVAANRRLMRCANQTNGDQWTHRVAMNNQVAQLAITQVGDRLTHYYTWYKGATKVTSADIAVFQYNYASKSYLGAGVLKVAGINGAIFLKDDNIVLFQFYPEIIPAPGGLSATSPSPMPMKVK